MTGFFIEGNFLENVTGTIREGVPDPVICPAATRRGVAATPEGGGNAHKFHRGSREPSYFHYIRKTGAIKSKSHRLFS
jgi:hypothetical protein